MRRKIFQQNSKIISNTEISSGYGYFKITLNSSRITSLAWPGQFVEIKVSDKYEPLLRRPFSIYRISHKPQACDLRAATCGLIEILYEVVGKGTEILSRKRPGEYLDIIGPLGKGFNLRLGTLKLQPILVAGGIGVAALLYLAERLVTKTPKHQDTKTPLVLIGAKTKSRILCEKEFRNLGCDVKIATDDGSKGLKGKITELLKYRLSTIDYRLSTIYACGPRPMLKEISFISKKYKIPAQISLEEHMACGIGACLGCVVDTKGGFKRVCQEGPVFEADEIVW